jgi:hypothetical protein
MTKQSEVSLLLVYVKISQTSQKKISKTFIKNYQLIPKILLNNLFSKPSNLNKLMPPDIRSVTLSEKSEDPCSLQILTIYGQN